MYAKCCLGACLVASALAWAGSAGALVVQDNDQARAAQRRQTGRALSAREIERRVIPGMRGYQYLGFDYDPESEIYTLKFLRDGNVVWVDVDGRTGRILRRTGS